MSAVTEYLQVEQYCPTQSMLKYRLIKAKKSNGFPFPTALVTYTHGNYVGNLNFLWKIQGDHESAFSDSQRVVEQLKQYIPTYHTRAMRREAFHQFGRLTSSVKPAVMRFGEHRI